VAVTAAALADRGERVLVVDYDAHHGNGTEEVFWRDPRVLYVSLHEWPLYPGTGALADVGAGDGLGATINIPLPAGATGDVYRRAVDDLIAPAAEAHGTTWLLVSAGYDAHRADPLTGLGLRAGDFADLTGDLLALAPAGRRLLFLEGGYDLDGLADSVGASLARGGRRRPPPRALDLRWPGWRRRRRRRPGPPPHRGLNLTFGARRPTRTGCPIWPTSSTTWPSAEGPT
jgi:acetoin utilization deacetylase AcuC-like enzyme